MYRPSYTQCLPVYFFEPDGYDSSDNVVTLTVYRSPVEIITTSRIPTVIPYFTQLLTVKTN